MNRKIISWWSGGVTSAVTCKICIDHYGRDNVRIVFIDTHNEHEDTYRFKEDCEAWYQKDIEVISAMPDKYSKIQDVWRRFNSLNIAGAGAICSSELKREVREKWQKHQDYDHQAFGFDTKEIHRARSMRIQHSKIGPIFPLLLIGYDKQDCINILDEANIEIPIPYILGFQNNNCFQTGCVQGGVGYWQKMARDFPEKYRAMASIEHELTEAKGQPVTVLKRQDKIALATKNTRLFLVPMTAYPDVWDLSMMKERKEQPALECNGFCGVDDLAPNDLAPKTKQTELEL